MPDPLTISDAIELPGDELSYEFSRAGGPGGQHVNTTDTRVRVRFALGRSRALRDEVKARIRAANPGRMTSDDELIVTCDTHRSRHRNIDDARERLASIVRAGLVVPKKRKKTKPSRGAKERRLKAKKARGDIKKGRQKVEYD